MTAKLTKDEKPKQGRPTKYNSIFDSIAKVLGEKGCIDTEIAEALSVDVATLNRWKIAHPSFCASLKSGKQYPDDKVVSALYNRALGYTVTEVKNEASETGKKVTTTEKHIAGDTTAQIFWLRNRMRDEWTNNPEPDDSDKTGQPINISFNVSKAIGDVKVTKGE